jgi:hypothetical protein
MAPWVRLIPTDTFAPLNVVPGLAGKNEGRRRCGSINVHTYLIDTTEHRLPLALTRVRVNGKHKAEGLGPHGEHCIR